MQFIQQSLGLLQIERVEAFGEPVVDRSKKIVGLVSVCPDRAEPRHAHRRAQLKTSRLLLTGDGDGGKERVLRGRGVRGIVLRQNLAADAMEVSVAPVLSCLLRQH